MKYLTWVNVLIATLAACTLLALALSFSAVRNVTAIQNQRDAEAHAPKPLAFQGFSPLGEAHISLYDRLYESAFTAGTTQINANACKNIDSQTIPPMTTGELAPYWGAAVISYDGINASLSCDGGTCSSFLTSILPADFHGGQLCVMGGATCAGTDGGGIDTKLLSFPAGNATVYGGTEQLVWSASLNQIQLQICCGTQACRAQGRISGQRLLASTVFDAGVDAADAADATDGSDASDASDANDAADATDAADASDASDASDSGGGITLVSIVPPVAYNNALDTHTFTVASGCTGSPSATVGGVAATSVTCTSSTEGTFVAPLLASGAGGLNGTTSQQTVVITMGGGTATGSGATNSLRYYAANTAVGAGYTGTVLAGGTWTSWPDSSGNGLTMASIGSPTTTTVNGHNSPTFNGTSQYADIGAGCTGGTTATIVAAAEVTQATALNGVADLYGASYELFVNMDVATDFRTQASDAIANNIYSANNSIAENSLYRIGVIDNGALSYIQVGSTLSSAQTLHAKETTLGLGIGALYTSSVWGDYFKGPIPEVIFYCGAISTTDLNLDLTNIQTTWNTL
jgi:hypothetical protein